MEPRLISCKNCGRIQHTTHPKKCFCNDVCKNMYHSRGVRRISQLEKRMSAAEVVLKLLAQAIGMDIESIYVDGELIKYKDPSPRLMGMASKGRP